MSASASSSPSPAPEVSDGLRRLVVLQYGYGHHFLPLIRHYYVMYSKINKCMEQHGNAKNWNTFPCYKPAPGKPKEPELYRQQNSTGHLPGATFKREADWIRYFVPLSSVGSLGNSVAQWDVTVLVSIILRSTCWSFNNDKSLIAAASAVRNDKNKLLSHTSSYEVEEVQLEAAAQHMVELAEAVHRLVSSDSHASRRDKAILSDFRDELFKFEKSIRTKTVDEALKFSGTKTELSAYLEEFKVKHPVSGTVHSKIEELLKVSTLTHDYVVKVLYYLGRLTKDNEFFCRFECNSSANSSWSGVRATVTLGQDWSDALTARDLRHSLQLDHLSLADVQIYGLLGSDMTQGYHATSARLLLSPRTEHQAARDSFIHSVQWSAAREDGCGFAVPETHFDVCGVAQGLGSGFGVKRSVSQKVHARFKEIAAAMKLSPSLEQADRWYLCFLAATSSELTTNDEQISLRGEYGVGSASDDFVYRLLPFFMQQASARLARLRQHRVEQRETQPLCTSTWTPMELLRLISGNEWEYFESMFVSCWDGPSLSTPYELLALPHFQIVLDSGKELRHWPIVSIAPQFLSFTNSPYGITRSRVEETLRTIKEETGHAAVQDVDELLSVFEEKKQHGTDLFHYFLHSCVISEVVMNRLSAVITLSATCEYAVILPSRPAFLELSKHLLQDGALAVQRHVLVLTFAPTDRPPSDAVRLAFTYINEDAELDESVQLIDGCGDEEREGKEEGKEMLDNEETEKTEEGSEEEEGGKGLEEDDDLEIEEEPEAKQGVEKEKRSLRETLSEVGGRSVGTVVLLFVEAFDMHRSKTRVLDIIAPYTLRRLTIKKSEVLFGKLGLALQAFIESDVYQSDFLSQTSALARPHLSPSSRFSEHPSVLLKHKASLLSSSNLDKLLGNTAMLQAADGILGAMASSVVDGMGGKDRNARCSLLPFFIITDTVVPRIMDPILAVRRSLAANVIYRFVSALLLFDIRKVLSAVEVEDALSVALEKGRNQVEDEEAAEAEGDGDEEKGSRKHLPANKKHKRKSRLRHPQRLRAHCPLPPTRPHQPQSTPCSLTA